METMMTNKLVIVMALVMLGGCMSEDPGIDDVASQESAVEETPAPTPGEDMRVMLQACFNLCGTQQQAADQNCINLFAAHWNRLLYDSCEDAAFRDESNCDMGCEHLWGTHGCGDHCL
jgi:hypothetical protein